MGRITNTLRDTADKVRRGSIAIKSQTGESGPDFHTGAWLIRYDTGTGPQEIGPTPNNFINAGMQKNMHRFGIRSNAKIRHVEEDFFTDLSARFISIKKDRWYLAPTDCQARVYFWLFYSPCRQCLEFIRANVLNAHTFGQNNVPECWLKMTFDRYYLGRGNGWSSADEAKAAYQKLTTDTNGQVIIREATPGN